MRGRVVLGVLEQEANEGLRLSMQGVVHRHHHDDAEQDSGNGGKQTHVDLTVERVLHN